MTALLGAVLAGGRSSRFGSDKAGAMLGGHSLAEHGRALLAPWCDDVVLVGREGGLVDLPRPGLGPLGGIAAALDHAAAQGFEAVLTIACDMPTLPSGLLPALLREKPAYCRDAPVLGHWPAALARHLIAYLGTAPNRSVRRWAEEVGAAAIPSPVPIANVNTPADLDALARRDAFSA